MALTDRRDQGDVPGSCPRVWLNMSMEVRLVQVLHLTGVQGLFQFNSHSKLHHLHGYAEFVTSAVRSAMAPFLQNMAQVVGEQTAQITQVSQRVDQLAAVVSQLSLNQASFRLEEVHREHLMVLHHLRGDKEKVVQV